MSGNHPRRVPLPWAVDFVACALVVLGLLATAPRGGGPPAAAEQAATPVASPAGVTGPPLADGANGPQQVTVGLYLMEIHGLDQEESTYFADFYLWLRWRGEFDPSPTFEFLNLTERWSLTKTQIFAQPVPLPSGERLQQFRVQGKFFKPLALKDYPLDKHELTIEIEDTILSRDYLVYVADAEGANISPTLHLPGWHLTGWHLTEHEHPYATDFGDNSAAEPTYSRVEFALGIERPENYFRWKLLLPLLIVLVLGCSVLVVHPTYAEIRLAGPATALLTLVFLQQSYTETLPETGSLVLLDKVYALAYGVVVGLIVATILTSHWVREGAEHTARAQRLDRVAAIGLFGLFLAGTAFLVVPEL